MSDHFMVYCIRKLNGAVTSGHKTIKIRTMKNFIEQLSLTDVASICWEKVFSQTDDIDVLVYYEWTTLFLLVVEKHAPLGKCMFLKSSVRGSPKTRGI